MDNREEKLKKLKELQQKIKDKNALPTVKKEEIGMSINTSNMNELKNSNNSINNKIKKISTSISTLKEAKQTLVTNAKKKTEVLFIIDKSGSVAGTEEIVSDGISKIIINEKAEKRNEIITLVLFNEKSHVVYKRTPINCVTRFDYEAKGETALYDTLVSQIEETKRNQEKDIVKPDKTIVVISTDGEDNKSKKTAYDVKKIIEDRKSAGWIFIFLGTNFNVIDEALRLGIDPDYSAEYDVLRLSDNFEAIKRALNDVYEKGTVTKDWSKPITDNKQLSSGENKQYKKLLGE